jgi:3-oxoacid CoA-transferase A subunit
MEVDQAVALIKSGDSVMVGSFGMRGYPAALVHALSCSPVSDLTVISCDLGSPGVGLGELLTMGKVSNLIGTFYTKNSDVMDAYLAGKVQIELIPMGTFAEAVRAGGVGVAGFYTATAVGTELSKGKESRVFNGREYLLQPALRAKVALIKAHKADAVGNLVYYKTAQNFNPQMAMAADLVIAEVDHLVPTGEIDPEHIITPHNFVDVLIVRTADSWPTTMV